MLIKSYPITYILQHSVELNFIYENEMESVMLVSRDIITYVRILYKTPNDMIYN